MAKRSPPRVAEPAKMIPAVANSGAQLPAAVPFAAETDELKELASWHQDPARKNLLRITLDQLRTLVLVHRYRSPYRAVMAMPGRQQSSVATQLTTLNTYSRDRLGAVLARDNGRGQDYTFTPTGDEFVQWAAEVLHSLDVRMGKCAANLGRELKIGATAFTIARIGPIIQRQREQDGTDIQVEQIRTKDLWPLLRSGRIQLASGAVVAPKGKPDYPRDFRFLATDPPDCAKVVTNLSRAELPSDELDEKTILKQCLVLPDGGIIVEYLKAALGAHYGDLQVISPRISDVYYGLNALASRSVKGSMVILEGVHNWFKQRQQELPLREIQLVGRFAAIKIITGLFAKEADFDEKIYGPAHPLHRLWALFEEDVKNRTSTAPD